MAAVSSALLSPSLTLVALIPALNQLLHSRAPDFVGSFELQMSLRRRVKVLAGAMLLFGLSLTSSIAGLLIVWELLFWLSLVTTVVGLFLFLGVATEFAIRYTN